jgi:hypothetical protein
MRTYFVNAPYKIFLPSSNNSLKHFMKAFFWWFLSFVQSLKKLPNMPSNIPALFLRRRLIDRIFLIRAKKFSEFWVRPQPTTRSLFDSFWFLLILVLPQPLKKYQKLIKKAIELCRFLLPKINFKNCRQNDQNIKNLPLQRYIFYVRRLAFFRLVLVGICQKIISNLFIHL